MCELRPGERYPLVSRHASRGLAEMLWARAEAVGYRLVSLTPYGMRGKWRLILAYPD